MRRCCAVGSTVTTEGWASQFFVLKRGSSSQSLVPAEILFGPNRKSLLYKGALNPPVVSQSRSHSGVQCFFKGHASLLHDRPNKSLYIRIERNGCPHIGIVASALMLS
jgi:hypothetical protein